MDFQFEYKKKNSFEKRKAEFERILAKPRFKDRVPVIVQEKPGCPYKINKNKFLVPQDLTWGQLMYVIRRRIEPALTAEKAIFAFVGNAAIVPVGYTIQKLQQEHKDEDGFLYVGYTTESTFG